MQYATTFVFDSRGQVALIRKNRPDYLAGKWNGIGGKLEPGETHVQAAIRELKEEANLDLKQEDLTEVLLFNGSKYDIKVFSAYVDANLSTLCESVTDEEVMVVRYNHLFEEGRGLLFDKHGLLFLQAAYISLTRDKDAPMMALVRS